MGSASELIAAEREHKNVKLCLDGLRDSESFTYRNSCITIIYGLKKIISFLSFIFFPFYPSFLSLLLYIYIYDLDYGLLSVVSTALTWNTFIYNEEEKHKV